MKLRILGTILHAAALIHRNPELARSLREVANELRELDQLPARRG